uniref:ANK_REP_REGION domain-containing protein n=1 Tax=Panagrellus redivivus TaxID=6233 RepID=A0A7E4W392_PANRE
MVACAIGSLRMVHLLVKYGATFGVLDLGQTCLGLACANGHLDVVKYLIALGHDGTSRSQLCPHPVITPPAAMDRAYDMRLEKLFTAISLNDIAYAEECFKDRPHPPRKERQHQPDEPTRHHTHHGRLCHVHFVHIDIIYIYMYPTFRHF